jgi:hypothetical protein
MSNKRFVIFLEWYGLIISNKYFVIPKLNISHSTIPNDHTSLLMVADFIECRHSGAVHFTGILSW